MQLKGKIKIIKHNYIFDWVDVFKSQIRFSIIDGYLDFFKKFT